MPTMDDLIRVVGSPTNSSEVKAFREANDDLVHEPPGPREREGVFDSRAGGYCITYAKRTKRIETVHVHIEAAEGHEAFTGELRGQLSHEADVDAVRAAWGEPTRSATDEDGTPWWDRFDSDDVCIHVRYCDGGNRFDLLTLMDPETAP